jgi:hypothetical protein
MSMFEWTIYVQDDMGRRQGEVDDYISAVLTPIYCDVGSWTLVVDRRSKAAADLTIPKWGITVYRNGVYQFSGPTDGADHKVDQSAEQVTITGFTENTYFTHRIASPSPAETVPPYTMQISDVRTGPCSTVLTGYVAANLGPNAIPTRQHPGLVMAPDPVVGATVRGEARWDANLLALMQPLAVTGGIGFQLVRVNGVLTFQTFLPTDRTTSVAFSIDLGNLAGFEYSSIAPTANYIYVGASGTGTARIIQEFQDSASIAKWGRREGPLASQSDTSSTTVIAQAGKDALTQGQEQAMVSATILEKPTLMYGTHYALGDKVTVQLEGPAATPYAVDGRITDILRSVEISLSVDGPQTITPIIGNADRNEVFRLFRAFRQLARRTNKLERQ